MGCVVRSLGVAFDCFAELGHAEEASSAERRPLAVAPPAFDQVHPRGARRNEREDVPRVATEPPPHPFPLGDAQVVEHHMDLQFGRHASIQDGLEREEVRQRVLGIVPCHHLAVEDVEGDAEVDRTVPSAVVTAAAGPVFPIGRMTRVRSALASAASRPR